MRMILFCLGLLASPALGHEFWLEPSEYQPATDAMLDARIVNGQNFGGIEIAYFPQRFTRFEVIHGETVAPVEQRMGNSPALQVPTLGEGLTVVVYQSTNASVTYESFYKFARFAWHKDFEGAITAHVTDGLPLAGFNEVYSRYVKTLFGVGTGAGADARAGLETEFVALDNPYTDDVSAGMRVQLFYGDQVRANAQVEVFEKPLETDVTPVLYQTDAQGIAVISVLPGHDYLVNAVVLRRPDAGLAAEFDAVWETLWASLTFAIPE
jgi:uncharacterized GH25 family protein